MNSNNATLKPTTPSLQGTNIGVLLNALPLETIGNVVSILRDVIHANKIMENNRQEFEHQLQMLQEKHLDRKERLQLLMGLVSSPNMPEGCIEKIVDSICNIAEGKNG